MNDNSTGADNTDESWAAFQKIWTDTFVKMMQSGFTVSPDTMPPELARQIRSGIFQALAQSWDQFLRSPQFLEGTKQWMDSAIAFRKMTNEFLTRARHEGQGTAREDIDSIMLAVRQMETRVLDRVQDLATHIADMNARLNARAGPKAAGRGTKEGRKAPRAGKRRPTQPPEAGTKNSKGTNRALGTR